MNRFLPTKNNPFGIDYSETWKNCRAIVQKYNFGRKTARIQGNSQGTFQQLMWLYCAKFNDADTKDVLVAKNCPALRSDMTGLASQFGYKTTATMSRHLDRLKEAALLDYYPNPDGDQRYKPVVIVFNEGLFTFYEREFSEATET